MAARLHAHPEELYNLPTSVNLITACRLLGLGRDTGYRLVKEGHFPIPVQQWGARTAVLRADLINALDPAGTAKPRSDTIAAAGQPRA